MYYDIDSIFNEAQASAVEEGKKLYYDSLAGLIGQEDLLGKRIFAFDDGRVSITFDEQGGLYDYACECGRCNAVDGPCEHVVCAALKLSESPGIYEKTPDVLKKTDTLILNIIKDCTRRRKIRLRNGEEKVELLPCFCISAEGDAGVRLKVGRGRKYAVKSINDFLLNIISAQQVRYGAGLRFKHTEEMFDARSIKLIRFLLKCRKDRQSIGSSAYPQRDELSLTYGEVDELLSLYEGREILFSNRNSLASMRLVTNGESVRPSLKIRKDDDGYTLNSGTGVAIIHEGRNHCYYITDTHIYRCKSELFESAGALIGALGKKDGLFISKTDMRAFYNNVLLGAGEYLDIETEDVDLSQMESPPLMAQLYFDRTVIGIAASLICKYGDAETDILSDDAIIAEYRDWETESKLKSLLCAYFPHYPSLELTEDSDIYLLLKEGLSELYGIADIFIAESLSAVRIKSAPRPTAGIRLNAGLLELDFSETDYTEEELEKISEAFKRQNKFVRLKDGSFIDIADDAVTALSGLLILGGRRGKKLTMPAHYAPLVDEKIKEGYLDASKDSAFTSFIEGFEDYKRLKIDFGTLEGTLRGYQRDGVRWLRMLKDSGLGGILADDMGLGKTIQILALLSDHKKGTSIVVCPTSLIINWAKEAAKFAPHLKTLEVMGNGKERTEQIERLSEFDLVITSYELFKRDEQAYKDYDFEIAVLDEAQFIKNHETKGARAVKNLNAKHRFALTGTPIENSLSELWSIFDFLMPGYLFGYQKFRTMYEAGVVKGNADTARELKKAVSPFILRRLKQNVLKELPPKTETEILIPLLLEQKEIYQRHLALIKSSLSGSGQKDRITILSMLMRLRQICCDPSIIDASYEGNSAKLESCLNLLRTSAKSKGKSLVFSQFTSMLDIIAKKLREENIRYYVLEGSTPKAERSRLVERFNEGDTPVFLISLRAGGTGLNLVGADTVIHYDPWWNDAVMNQATDRAYRLGQKNSVSVYKLIMKDSLEERIVALQRKKSALAGLYIDEASVSMDDLLTLLGE